MLVELGTRRLGPQYAAGVQKALDRQLINPSQAAAPVVVYTHIPDTYSFDRNVDTEQFRQHLTRAVMFNRGITNFEGAEALLPLTHPTMGIWPDVSDAPPDWVWSDDKDISRFLSEYYQVQGYSASGEGEAHQDNKPPNYLAYWRRLPSGLRLPPGVFPTAFGPQNLVTNVGISLLCNNLGGGQVGFAGTATASSSTSLTDSSASWTSNQWAGYRVYDSATGVWGNIVSNTSTVLTVDQWYNPATPGGSAGSTPGSTDKFIIADGGCTSCWFTGITTTNITPGYTDTSLSGEATTNGMARKISTFTVTSAVSGGSETFTLSTTFTYSGSGATTFYALGQFNSIVKTDTTDTMAIESSFSGSFTVTNSGDQATVTETVTVS